jgi:hypothetical protein
MPVSEEMIDAAWSGVASPMAQLVTIRSDADPTPITATDWPDGITSNGVDYPYYPFQLSWAGAGKDQPFGQGRLTIQNVDRRIEAACDAAQDPPEIDLTLVRVDAPDYPETAIRDARVPSVEGDASKVAAVIRPRSFNEEPACAAVYNPSAFAGLF